MLFERLKIFVAGTCVSSVMAVTCYAQSNSLPESPLADRIEAGDRKAALELIARNAPLNSAQPSGTTPLHWAVYRVDEELVKALLTRGAKATTLSMRMARALWRRL